MESRDRDSIGLNGDRNSDKASTSNLKASNDRPPSRSGSSSSRSTPNLKTKDVSYKSCAILQNLKSTFIKFLARQAGYTGCQRAIINTQLLLSKWCVKGCTTTKSSSLPIVTLSTRRGSLSKTST